MHTRARTIRDSNLSRKTVKNKSKDFLELAKTNNIFETYSYDSKITSLEYAEALVNCYETISPKVTGDGQLDFYEDTSLIDLIIDLEQYLTKTVTVYNGQLLSRYNEEEKKHFYIYRTTLPVDIYSIEFHFEDLYLFKNEQLRIAYAKTVMAFTDLSDHFAIHRRYNTEDYCYRTDMEIESFLEDEYDEESEFVSNLKDLKSKIESSKLRAKESKIVNDLIDYSEMELDLDSYKPRAKKNKILKEHFQEFLSIHNSIDWSNVTENKDCSSSSGSSVRDAMQVFPNRSMVFQYEADQMEQFANESSPPCLDYNIKFDENEVFNKENFEYAYSNCESHYSLLSEISFYVTRYNVL